MIVSVVGMGKIGLPLAVQYASRGHTVVGIDISEKTVDFVNEGKEPFPGEAGLAEALLDVRHKGLLTATTSYGSAIPESDVVVVVVPLFVDDDDQPDFRWMDSATQSIGAHLTTDTLVIYETTLPIGTTRNRWKPMLERESSLKEGRDFHLVFSPERVLTGRVFEDLRKYPKLVGGLSPAGAKRAIKFYDSTLEFDERKDLAEENGVWDLGSAEAAEMAKLAETTYRDVNIALANQFALHAQEVGVDIYKVIEACNSQPYSHIHQPGISVGGHCIPVYPRLYLSTDSYGGVVEEARRLNSMMPMRIVEKFASLFGNLEGATILILGASYRNGVKETAYSGVFSLFRHLQQLGAIPVVADPFYTEQELAHLGLTPVTEKEKIAGIILHTAHPDFLDMAFSDFPTVRLVVDGRKFLRRENWLETQFFQFGSPD